MTDTSQQRNKYNYDIPASGQGIKTCYRYENNIGKSNFYVGLFYFLLIIVLVLSFHTPSPLPTATVMHFPGWPDGGVWRIDWGWDGRNW